MSTQIEERLRAYFDEAANRTAAAPTVRFRPTDQSRTSSSPRRPRTLTICAAAFVVTLAGLVAIRSRDDGPAQPDQPLESPVATTSEIASSIPSSDPPLFAPPESATVSVTSHAVHSMSGAAGAVIAPDGRIFGIGLSPASSLAAPTGDLRHIGEFDVRAMTDRTAPEEIYRWISSGCLALDITTAGEAAFSANTEALIEGLTIRDDDVTLTLPTGWSLLGASARKTQYQSGLHIAVGDTTTELNLFQMPDTSIGVYLVSFETPPQPIDVNGDPSWVIPSATTEGYTTLVGERDGTAFTLSGRATPAELIAVAESFVRAPLVSWTSSEPANAPIVTSEPAPSGCTVPPLSITGPG